MGCKTEVKWDLWRLNMFSEIKIAVVTFRYHKHVVSMERNLQRLEGDLIHLVEILVKTLHIASLESAI